MTETKKENKK